MYSFTLILLNMLNAAQFRVPERCVVNHYVTELIEDQEFDPREWCKVGGMLFFDIVPNPPSAGR